jgi:cobaltochelatase CobN
MNPLDTAMNVALPEFDGRIIGVPLSFKQTRPGQRDCSRPAGPRAASPAWRSAWCAALHAQCAQAHRLHLHQFQQQGRADRQCRGAGCAASLMPCCCALQANGYGIGDLPDSGDALIHELVDRCSYDDILLTEDQLRRAAARIPAARRNGSTPCLPFCKQDAAPVGRRTW